MVIIVFGATGMVGRKIVSYALAQGHTVRAFGRNIEKLIDEDLRNDKFEAIQGSVFDANEVYGAVGGADIVLSALGGAFDGGDKTRSLGIKTIAAQMQDAGVMRLVALGGIGVLDAGDGTYILDKPSYPAAYEPVGREHLQAFINLKDTKLDWTFVCAPTIKDTAESGHFVTSDTYVPVPNYNYVTADDLAIFMVNEALQNKHLHKRVGISSGQ